MMKTLKNTLVVMAMLGTITGYANLEPSFPPNEKVKTTIIRLDNLRQGQRLLIKSKSGTILYNESISKNGAYIKEFDLTSLPNGNYFFELDKDVEIQIIPFSVSAKTVTFSKENEVIIFKPNIRTKANQLLFSKLSLERHPVSLEIYYDNPNSASFEKIYSEKIEKTKVIERVFSLDNNRSGNYKIITKTDGRVYTQIFTI